MDMVTVLGNSIKVMDEEVGKLSIVVIDIYGLLGVEIRRMFFLSLFGAVSLFFHITFL